MPKSQNGQIYIDFSGTPFHKSGWIWELNMPIGTLPCPDSIAKEIRRLQKSYGCLNVSSGNANPLSAVEIGVYYLPTNDRKHREGVMCTCFDDGDSEDGRTPDVAVWPPRW